MKVFFICISIVFSFNIAIIAQTNSNDPNYLMSQAQEHLDRNKYIEARYFYKKAYEGFAAQGDYSKAVKCGLKADSLFVKENLYKNAFELLRGMETLIEDGEKKESAKFYDLRLLISKERLRMYMQMKNTERAREQLAVMNEISKLANSDFISEDVLYSQANYYFTFGPVEQGTNYYNKLIDKYEQTGDLQKVDDCYRNMVNLAEKVNNASLVVSAYKQYIAWKDSIGSIIATNELITMKQKYDDSQSILQEKESSLSSRQYIIVALCVSSAVLIFVLIVFATILLRYKQLISKQKKNIEIANKHNQLKSQFIQNISAQMDPTLNTLALVIGELPAKKDQLEQMQTQIGSLRNFSNNIQELSYLENSLDKLYELKDCYVNTFCEEIVKKIRPLVNLNVDIQVYAFKLQAKINQEQLERVLIHLLKNAAYYTTTGKISLEFKKKGAHVHQFIVTDTGLGIPEELKENLFKPFAEIKDLTQGDGLGLPICSLITIKMNGNLSLDTSYTNGSRFILELRT